MKIRLILICLVLIILTGLITVISLRKPLSEKGREERVLKLGTLGGDPSIINPIITNQTVSQAILPLIFNSLVRLDRHAEPKPDLAKSWDSSEDGLIHTFYLRRGVKFHDGVECTAEDVKFTYELAGNPEVSSIWLSYLSSIKTLEVLDKYTFRFILEKPEQSFLNLVVIPIIPKHLFPISKISEFATAEFNYKPIGTGPFKFAEWTEDNKIILQANPYYYEGKPYLNKIIATGYDTFSQYWLALMHGETDVIFFLPKESYETIKRDPDFKTYKYSYLFAYGLEYNLDHPFFGNKEIGEAFAHGINIRNIIDKVEDGNGIQSTGPFHPDLWLYNPDIKPVEYNSDLAVKLLNEAGWYINDNGILEKDGKEFRFIMLLDDEIRNSAMIARFIYQDLYRMGIRMDIKSLEYIKSDNEYKDLVRESGAYLNIFPVILDPIDLVNNWYSKNSVRRTKLWSYKNKQLDELYETAMKNTSQLQELYQKIHQIIYQDQAVTFLYFLDNFGAVNAKFQNTESLFSISMPLYTIKDWRIK